MDRQVIDRRPDEPPPLPPREEFWQAYNAHLELPTSALITLLLHAVLVAGLFGVMMIVRNSGDDKSSVPIRLVEGGEDDSGLGNKDAAGVSEPLVRGDTSGPTMADVAQLSLPNSLPEVQKDFQRIIELDPDLATANVTATPEKSAAYQALEETIKKKLLGPPGQKEGKGGDSSDPSGIGSDATKARSLRWVLRFKTTDGRDYLNQLAGLGAIVIVPVPPENSAAYVFRDLANPRPGEQVSEAEWQKLAQQVQFCDFKQDSVRQVTAELGLSRLKAQMFWAFFPKALEEDMANKERSHQNRPAESIAETVYEVSMVNGRHEMRVVRQTLK